MFLFVFESLLSVLASTKLRKWSLTLISDRKPSVYSGFEGCIIDPYLDADLALGVDQDTDTDLDPALDADPDMVIDQMVHLDLDLKIGPDIDMDLDVDLHHDAELELDLDLDDIQIWIWS